ncbi:MAG: PEP-CTERM sorting domain-containing protein [Planctomycetales bacterium]|nr:PEP-CTERM sorting domain-containing protein [Planctomycetales bacterium]MCA9170570.1 PEP-CTERM sorting domain-containing protein [Planctomycetales bacterium]
MDNNSTWSTGDWNGDGEFTTSDLVVAFQDGGYEQGPRSAVSSVPESSGMLSLLIGGMLSLFARSRR